MTHSVKTKYFVCVCSKFGIVCAESSSDYVAVNEELTFASCDTQLCVSVRITDDLISEPDEMFSVSLTLTTPTDSFITLSSVAAEVVITDNDGKK